MTQRTNVGTVEDLQASATKLCGLDDFGAENNSIGYLKRYDFNYLKIDKEFLPVTEDDVVTRNICDSIIHLAERLDMTIVAEGVENEMQASYLRTRNVTYAQGYLFARPISFDELVQFAIAHAGTGLTAVKRGAPAPSRLPSPRMTG